VSAFDLPVATDWFGVEDVGEGVTRLTEPHLDELVSANLWWIRGQRHDVLLDTGLGVASRRAPHPAVGAPGRPPPAARPPPTTRSRS
jgi:hypothetical protein